MNIAFSKILKIGERNFEFNFRKRPSSLPLYHVDVTDEKGTRILFTMTKSAANQWASDGNAIPLWVVACEHVLGNVIEEEEQAFIHE